MLSAAEQKELQEQYVKFNTRLKIFLGDLGKVYGSKYSGLLQLKQQVEAFTRLDPGRMMLAHKAWPMFREHQDLIDAKDDTVFTKYDLAGLKSRAGVDTVAIWARASANSREQMWNAMDDLLDALLMTFSFNE